MPIILWITVFEAHRQKRMLNFLLKPKLQGNNFQRKELQQRHTSCGQPYDVCMFFFSFFNTV